MLAIVGVGVRMNERDESRLRMPGRPELPFAVVDTDCGVGGVAGPWCTLLEKPHPNERVLVRARAAW